MKASAIAYGGILVILIITSLVTVYIIGGAEPVSRNIVSIEGRLMSFADEADILTKTFNQSIEFISQRAAYDLGLNGGINRPEIFWNYYYPRIDVLEKKLEESIENNLPSKPIKNKVEITWGESEIDVSKYDEFPCGPLKNSKCFLVSGEKNFSIYDESIQSRIDFKPFKISSNIKSSYFKLLFAGREILENETYNSTLNDIGNLENLLEADPRFEDLEFQIIASDSTVEITIEDKTCMEFYNEYYCLAPLKPGEEGITLETGERISYDYLKLKFKVNATQTSFTPPKFDFRIWVDPESGYVKSGGSAGTRVYISSTGAITKPVHLDYTVTSATGNPEANPETIEVEFEKNDREPNFKSNVIIRTKSYTIADAYTITITGTGDGVTKETIFTLTVNPTMEFDLSLNPSTATIMQGEEASTSIDLTFLSGTAVPVFLYASEEPPNSQLTLSTDTCTPTCNSTMTISTSYPDTPYGTYEIKVVAIGGGLRKTAKFTLTIQPYFDFEILLSPDRDTIAQGEPSSSIVTVDLKSIETRTVDLSYTIISITSGSTDPNNFGISVSFDQNSGNPTFSTTMRITTQTTTPYDEYAIIVTGTSEDIIRTKTFTLTVKKPECFSDSDCNDGKPCTGVKDEGGIDKCRNSGKVNAYCERPNLPYGYIPDSSCGTLSKTCGNKCENGYEYRDGIKKTCNLACDGVGSCLKDCTPSCTPSDYNTIKDCYYECKDNLRCREAYFCSEESCQTCNSWCALNSCDTSWGCGSCTVSGQVRRGNESDPFCTYYWPACGGYLCSLCVCTQETCTASCSYDETCTYGKFCPKQTFTVSDNDCGAPNGSCTPDATNSCTTPLACAYSGNEPTCTMNTDYKCDWFGYVYYNCRWEPPSATYTASCS